MAGWRAGAVIACQAVNKTSRLSLAGMFPPLPTPFRPDGALDLEALRGLLRTLDEEPLAGYLVGGSNGEFTSLSRDERLEVVSAAREVIPRSRLLIAGSGAESTRETNTLTREMAERGADAVLVVTPSYFKSRMTPAALEAHFRRVADAAPVPVILYNVPSNTGIDLPAAPVIKLAKHPNIIGFKDSSGDLQKMALIIRETGPDFQVLAGSAGYLLASMVIGAVGAVGALANIAARPLHRLMACARSGAIEEARGIQLRLVEANLAVTARFGVPGLKAAIEMCGRPAGLVREPLLPLEPEEKATLRAILTRAELLPA
jgi:4-hydroxy-2-oxoglutarate aldolase